MLSRAMLKRLRNELLLLILLAGLPLLLWLRPVSLRELPALVDWQTIGALAAAIRPAEISGGFGLAIGSLANLIALRLAHIPGLWLEFHRSMGREDLNLIVERG